MRRPADHDPRLSPRYALLVAASILSFPVLLFSLHRLRTGWNRWYRRWEIRSIRFGGWITIRKWTFGFPQRGLPAAVGESQNPLECPLHPVRGSPSRGDDRDSSEVVVLLETQDEKLAQMRASMQLEWLEPVRSVKVKDGRVMLTPELPRFAFSSILLEKSRRSQPYRAALVKITSIAGTVEVRDTATCVYPIGPRRTVVSGCRIPDRKSRRQTIDRRDRESPARKTPSMPGRSPCPAKRATPRSSRCRKCDGAGSRTVADPADCLPSTSATKDW